MADEPIKKLLIKLGISTSDWKTAINEIKSQLNTVNEAAKRDAAQQKATQKESIDLTRQQIADQKRLQAEAKVLQEVDRAKAVWQKQQQEAIRTTIQQRVLETTEVKKQQVLAQGTVRLEQEKLRLAQQQYAFQQRQTQEQLRQQKAQSGSGGGSGLMGGIGRFVSGIAGGGMLGSIAGGVLTGGLIGEGAIKLLDSAGQKIHSLGQALLDATGPAVQLREQFEKLTARSGTDPSDYLNKLRTATRGLADDVSLYRIANNYMQQGLKVSNDSIVRLVAATVNLARAQGKDAPTAMAALERASKTGRAQVLAMVTGLTRQELQLKGVSSAMDATTRNTLQFNQVLAALEAREKAIGTPAATLPELFKQWLTVQKNVIDDMAVSITRTDGFKNVISELSGVLTKLTPILSEFAEFIGSRIGDALDLVMPGLNLIISTFNLLKTSVTAFFQVVDALTGVASSVEQAQKKISPFKELIMDLSLGFLTLSQYANEAAIHISAAGDIAEAVAKGKFSAAKAIFDSIDTKIADSRLQYGADVAGVIREGYGLNKGKPEKAGPQQDVNFNPSATKQRQQLELQIAKETAQIKYEMALEYLKKQEDATKAAYEAGTIDLYTEVTKQRAINKAEHEAKIRDIEEERDAKIKSIRVQGKESGTPADIIKKQVDVANLGAQQKFVSENTAYQQKGAGLDKQSAADKEAAYRTYVDALSKIAKDGVQERLQILEQEFKQGLVGADDYLQQRRDLINQETQITVTGLQDQLGAAKNNAAETAKINSQIAEAKINGEKQVTLLMGQQDEIKLKTLQTKYQLSTRPYQTQVNIAQGDITGRSAGVETGARQQLLGLAQQHLNDLMQQTPKKGSDDWLKLQEDIEKTTLEIQKLNLELIKSQNMSRPLGGIFSSISGLAGAIPRSRTAAGASELFGNMAGASQDISKSVDYNAAIMQQHKEAVRQNDIAATTGGAATATGPTNIITSLTQSFTGLFKATEPLSDRLTQFETALTSVISGVMGMVKGVTSGKSGGAGALSGAASGMQEGAMFGPWGALIGAGVGGTLGGIFGSKTKSLTEDIHKIQTQMQSIVSDMAAGTISMSQAISDLRQERQQAIALLSQNPKGGKGGGKGAKKGYTPSQAQAVIEQIDTQINALVSQQSVILENLSTSLMELSNPIQFQDYLQSLDQIIQKYQQFASAAQGNAQEVAAANQYLNDSLQQYVTTLSQQLNQAQQQAIQDALTLINLEYQRQQIINQEAQQEYDVLTQGVLTRQRTTAMTKGQEIGQLRYQRDMQLEQINEEISLQQYKVASEQQIFGLATTRIGLETQLLEAQEEQANYQILQVQALAQVVTALQSGMSSGALSATITNLMSSGAMPTESGIMYTLLQELGLAGNVPPTATQGQYGITNWLSAIPATDASAASYVAGLDPNFPNMILAGQYASAASDASQYVQQGEIEGFDMTGLVSWLQSQAANPPGAASGGDITAPVMVGENGPELLLPPTKGTVLSNPIVSALNTMMGTSAPPTSSSTSDLVQTHQTLLNITQQRASLEMTVISARQSQIQLEMQYMQSLQDTLSAVNNSNTGSPVLESMLNQVYQTRGRYGSGNFRRETP
jgi:hypothetical protein